MGSEGDEIRKPAEYVLSIAFLMLRGHLFSFLCLSIYSASSASVYLALYVSIPHPSTPGLCRMQAEGASGVDVLLAFGPPLGPSPAQRFGVASAASGFPNPFRVSAILFRRLDSHQRCALAQCQAVVHTLKSSDSTLIKKKNLLPI